MKKGKEGDKEVKRIWLEDDAKCNVYVCFEGSLGSH